MKISNFSTIAFLLLMTILMSSCDIVTGIFKAGMGFGIFLVVGIIIAVVALIMRVGRK